MRPAKGTFRIFFHESGVVSKSHPVPARLNAPLALCPASAGGAYCPLLQPPGLLAPSSNLRGPPAVSPHPPPCHTSSAASPGLSLCVTWHHFSGGLTLRGELVCCPPASCRGPSATEPSRTGAAEATQPVSGRGVRAGVYVSQCHRGALGAGATALEGPLQGGDARCRLRPRHGRGLPRPESCSAFSQLPPSSRLPTQDGIEFA